MRLGAAPIACALLCLAPALSSCGGGGDAATGTPPRSGSTVSASRPAPRGSCGLQLDGFIGSLTALRRSLSRGLSYTEYLPTVRGVRIAYRAIKPRELDATCLLLAGGPAEQAFNSYIDAANSWGACLTTVGCTTASVELKLQRKWSHASEQLSRAQRAMKSPSR